MIPNNLSEWNMELVVTGTVILKNYILKRIHEYEVSELYQKNR